MVKIKVQINCKNCKKEYEGTYKLGRFCSSKCVRDYSNNTNQIGINKKLLQKLLENLLKTEDVKQSTGTYNKQRRENLEALYSNGHS